MPRSAKPQPDNIRGRPKPRKRPVRKSKKRTEHLAGVKLTSCTIQNRQVVNGLPYGPGSVKVPRELAYTLLELDRRTALVEAALYTDKAVMILSSNRAVPVAPASFQMLWAGENSPIFDVQSGKGLMDVQQPGSFTF